MTNQFNDIKNSDVVLIMGSNAAENHPIAFRWVQKAKENGGKVIHVDPRFTRTSQLSDMYCELRPGTDIAFIGGMIKYIFDNKLYDEWYIKEYSDASFLVADGFKTATEANGAFSGLDGKKYDKATWAYQQDEKKMYKRDMTLKNPSCVFQLMKKQYSRYTLDLVAKVCGVDKAKVEEVYKAYAATGKPDKAGVILYAMGTTQHTYGSQNVRAFAVLQTLLGNMGIAGGGVDALRGEANVQGSTDFALLFHLLPGYLSAPSASVKDLKTWIEKNAVKTEDKKSFNWKQNYGKYMISLLKAKYGDYATKQNDFAYDLLPKFDDGKNHSYMSLFEAMYKGSVEGLFLWGMNPVVGGANSRMIRKGLAKLKWMVAIDLWETETAAFWQKDAGANPADIKTEVFMLPSCSSVEKEGTVSNSGRWVQWRYKAVNPLGDSKPDLDIANDLYFELKGLYKKSGGALPEQLTELTWNYGFKGGDGKIHHPDPDAVLKEINGSTDKDLEDPKKKGEIAVKKGERVPSFAFLQDDGSTACGCWIYAGCYGEKGNFTQRRVAKDPTGMGLYNEWTWCWPVNRRIIYNRASVDWEGKPRNPKKAILWWNAKTEKWVGDVPDGPPPPGDIMPFIMNIEGVAKLFAQGMNDGPFPEHYEPLECTVSNLVSKTQMNPTIKRWDIEGSQDSKAAAFGSEFCNTYHTVCTTYRVSEHWQTGQMTRWLPWVSEAMPEPFVEMSEEFAQKKGISNGDRVKVSSVRAPDGLVFKAIVTKRLRPFKLEGQVVDVVGIPWHWGYKGLATGAITNELTPSIGDANTMIPEYKAFLVKVEKA